jgi:hypothetical protein
MCGWIGQKGFESVDLSFTDTVQCMARILPEDFIEWPWEAHVICYT